MIRSRRMLCRCWNNGDKERVIPELSGVKRIRRRILFRNGRQEEMLRRHRLILAIRIHFNHPPAVVAAISIRLIFLLLHLQTRRTTTIQICSTRQRRRRRLRSIRMSIRTRIIRQVEHSMLNQRRRVPRRTAAFKRRLLRMSLVRRFPSSVFFSSRQLEKISQRDNERERIKR